jgi:L-ascorbate metabolism protein UlaG (beta-lactamase superfamily)
VENSRARINYLFHSGFSVETASHFLLFDYCPSLVRDPIITNELLKTKENIYVFVSHSHGDHFDPAILQWAKINPSIKYVFSSDVPLDPGTIDCRVMSAYERWADGTIEVETFGSTDEGISFLVQVDGLSIFHAGDLNWWRWKGETQAEQGYAEKIFKEEIGKIAGQKIDIAFFPVDRRLEEYYSLGAEYFAAGLQPKLLVPMHFGKDFGATKAFADRARDISLATVEITRRGQEILF